MLHYTVLGVIARFLHGEVILVLLLSLRAPLLGADGSTVDQAFLRVNLAIFHRPLGFRLFFFGHAPLILACGPTI